jgi:formyl-CoA transferase
MGNDSLAVDKRFSTYHSRVANQEALYEIIEAWAGNIKAENVEELLADAGVPVSRSMSIADIAASQHYREREAVVVQDDPEFGTVMMPGVFPRLSGTPGKITNLGPRLGSSNAEVYADLLGLSAAQLQGLERDGVV